MGWVLPVAMALGFCNAAAFGVERQSVELAQLFNAPERASVARNLPVVLLTGLPILSTCGWLSHREITTTQTVQYGLVGGQL